MKLKLTIEVVYEIAEDSIAASYGTTDPAECAQIDENNYREMPELIAEAIQFNNGLTVKVETI